MVLHRLFTQLKNPQSDINSAFKGLAPIKCCSSRMGRTACLTSFLRLTQHMGLWGVRHSALIGDGGQTVDSDLTVSQPCMGWMSLSNFSPQSSGGNAKGEAERL